MKQYESLMFQWIINENRGLTVENYLHNLGVQKILIYGAGIIGEILFQVLKKSEVQVLGFIDQNKSQLLKKLHGLPVMTLEQINNKSNYDTIVVTLGHLYYEIESEIKNINKEIKIVSIETIIYGIMRGDE